MALKPNLIRPKYTISSEKENHQRLGEILHFSLSYILFNHQLLNELNPDNIVTRALLHSRSSPYNLTTIAYSAETIIENILNNPHLKELLDLVRDAKQIYSEIEIFASDDNRSYRPDFIIEKDNLLILLEFKLREEDFSEDQLKRYIELLRNLFPQHGLLAYLVTFTPFTLKLLKNLESDKGSHGTQRISHISQLTLFKNLS